MPYTFSPHFLTLADVRRRLERKLRNDQIPDDLDDLINDAVYIITSEFPQESLISDGTDSITGDGNTQIFPLPADFQHMLVVHERARNYTVGDVSPQAMIETWELFPVATRSAQVFTVVGRKGAVGVSELSGVLNPLRIKFDAKIPTGEVYHYAYFKLHHKLVNDTDPLLITPELHTLVVDGAMVEGGLVQGSEDYERYERKFERALRRGRRLQTRYPARRIVMGSDQGGGKPAPPRLPSQYPR
jgi:hypothetical protein